MKKFAAVLLAGAMICSLAACGGDKKETEAPETKVTEAAKEDTEAPETDAKAEDTTAAGTESAETKAEGESGGKLIMATEAGFAPYEYTEDGSTVVGVDVDIANEIAKAMGKELEIRRLL